MKTAAREGEVRQLTLRLPADLFALADRLARARGLSLSGLLRELLDQAARAERERELARAYEVLGAEDTDVEPFFDGQAEVARRG